MIQRLIAASLFALFLVGCSKSTENKENPFAEQAAEIARTSIIVDTHIDVPYRLATKPDDVSKATEKGDFDYPRAVAGGLNAPFMSIYTPASLELRGESKAKADELIDGVEAIVQQAPDKFVLPGPQVVVETTTNSSVKERFRCRSVARSPVPSMLHGEQRGHDDVRPSIRDLVADGMEGELSPLHEWVRGLSASDGCRIQPEMNPTCSTSLMTVRIPELDTRSAVAVSQTNGTS